MKSLLEAGVHFGHQTRRWNPKMKKFIFGERNGIHIIDLQQTVDRLEDAAAFVSDLVSSGQTILFVGTKRQAQDTIESEARRCGMPFVNPRWLGGTLTNFHTIQGRIDYLVRLEDARARGELDHLTKKEGLRTEEEIVRLNRYLGGIKEMTNLPGCVFIIDTTKEDIAVAEALRTGTPRRGHPQPRNRPGGRPARGGRPRGGRPPRRRRRRSPPWPRSRPRRSR